MIIETPHLTRDHFADLMAEHPAGVAVVTTRNGALPSGLLVTSLSAFTADPPSILFAVCERSRSHDALVTGSAFGVHLLSRRQADVAKVFASLSDAKFDALPWSWQRDVPRIHDVLAYMRCERDAVFRHLDHSIVVGRLVTVIRPDSTIEPLLYRRRSMEWAVEGRG
jgi:flavin reductase (DIM6/NTAB) family NADH-FMN oxidoreductase RutF